MLEREYRYMVRVVVVALKPGYELGRKDGGVHSREDVNGHVVSWAQAGVIMCVIIKTGLSVA